MLKLIKVNSEYINEIKSYRDEMFEYASTFDGCNSLEDYSDIEEWIKYCRSLESYKTMPKECKLVPAIEYILVDESSHQVLGMFNLRLELNDFLLSVGGHIGYSIRPSERRKGYAKEGLKLVLKICRKEFNFDRVLITCKKENIASSKTIKACGGIIENEVQSDVYKTIIQRYWIPIKYMVNNIEYSIISFLGRGKGGYSYLARANNKFVTLKKIHHEPCEYYNFGNKIEAEKNDYERISSTGIRIPKMIYIDENQEIIIKEYVDGPTIMELINANKDISAYIPQVKEMAKLAYSKWLNIDYYPTNFVVQDNLVYYIDYECNVYSDEWNFENWGIKTWKKA